MTYPRWLTTPGGLRNLREVAPRLYVGSRVSPSENVGVPFELVVNLCGLADQDRPRYRGAREAVIAAFADGDPIPEHYLNELVPRVRKALKRGPVLLHCAAGLSRSASMAYAVLRVGGGLSHDDALLRVQVPGYEFQYPMSATLGSARAWVHAHRARQPKMATYRDIEPISSSSTP